MKDPTLTSRDAVRLAAENRALRDLVAAVHALAVSSPQAAPGHEAAEHSREHDSMVQLGVLTDLDGHDSISSLAIAARLLRLYASAPIGYLAYIRSDDDGEDQ